jgi:hypothetical protein
LSTVALPTTRAVDWRGGCCSVACGGGTKDASGTPNDDEPMVVLDEGTRQHCAVGRILDTMRMDGTMASRPRSLVSTLTPGGSIGTKALLLLLLRLLLLLLTELE